MLDRQGRYGVPCIKGVGLKGAEAGLNYLTVTVVRLWGAFPRISFQMLINVVSSPLLPFLYVTLDKRTKSPFAFMSSKVWLVSSSSFSSMIHMLSPMFKQTLGRVIYLINLCLSAVYLSYIFRDLTFK